MKYKKAISILVLCIIVISAMTAIIGIISDYGPGAYDYESIRGETITIYGKGLYQHMSSEVAVQDYVTLFIGIPLLLISLYFARKESVKGRFVLAGTLGYFLVTYLFYFIMSMYNLLYLGYAFLLGACFFAFTLIMLSFDINNLSKHFNIKTPVKFTGRFLIFNAIAIAFLWLSIVVPPLIDGSIYKRL